MIDKCIILVLGRQRVVAATPFSPGWFFVGWRGGDDLRRSGIGTASRYIPHVIGLTVIAFGTSVPELFVSLKAALQGSPGIAIGNVIGSNIANILLMIGTVGVVAPFVCRGLARRDGLMLFVATMLFVAAAMHGVIERWHGAVMVVLLVSYLYYCYRSEGVRIPTRPCTQKRSRSSTICRRPHEGRYARRTAVLFGADLLGRVRSKLHASPGFRRRLSVLRSWLSHLVPELATTMVAALRRHSDVALGNIIGSNIFNTLGILGVVAIVSPLPVPPEVLSLDLWVMMAVTVIFIVMAIRLPAFSRPWAVIFFVAYVTFITNQFYPLTGLALAAG